MCIQLAARAAVTAPLADWEASVLAQVRTQVAAGKVKKEGGAVFKALSDGCLLADYQKISPPPVAAKSPANPAALTKKRLKLRRPAGKCFHHPGIRADYPGISLKRHNPSAAEQRVLETIVALEAQLAELPPPLPHRASSGRFLLKAEFWPGSQADRQPYAAPVVANLLPPASATVRYRNLPGTIFSQAAGASCLSPERRPAYQHPFGRATTGTTTQRAGKEPVPTPQSNRASAA